MPVLAHRIVPTAQADLLEGGPAQSKYLFAILVGTIACAFWPVIFAPMMGVVKDIPKTLHNTRADTTRYLVTMTILVSLSTFYALAYARDSNGVWLPLTLLMVLQVAPGATKHRALQRAYGTVAGAVLSAVVATAFHSTWVIAVIAMIAFLGLLATVGREPYSVFAFFLTILVLLGVSATEPPLEASMQRIVYTGIGCAIALALYSLKQAVSHDVREDQEQDGAGSGAHAA